MAARLPPKDFKKRKETLDLMNFLKINLLAILI
jgi:hypothetical protein